jgi:hypothetical protein
MLLGENDQQKTRLEMSFLIATSVPLQNSFYTCRDGHSACADHRFARQVAVKPLPSSLSSFLCSERFVGTV